MSAIDSTDSVTSRGRSPGPGSLLWDIYSDITLAPFATPILVLQAAHPAIGDAVANYSVYKQEPWGRLFRTGFSMMRFLHGGRQGRRGRQEAKTLRRLHAPIKGYYQDGTPYHALQSENFRIVPDTFLWGAIHYREVMGEPLSTQERLQIFREYSDLCLLFGISGEILDEDLDEFLQYFDRLLLETMTYNETVAFLLGDMMVYGPRIPYLPLPQRWWQWCYHKLFFPPIRLFTLGFLDTRFRAKHDIAWSEQDEQRYRRWVKGVRFVRRILPRWLRYSPFALYIMLGGSGPRPISPERLKKMH